MERLSALDAEFLHLEDGAAHMAHRRRMRVPRSSTLHRGIRGAHRRQAALDPEVPSAGPDGASRARPTDMGGRSALRSRGRTSTGAALPAPGDDAIFRQLMGRLMSHISRPEQSTVGTVVGRGSREAAGGPSCARSITAWSTGSPESVCSPSCWTSTAGYHGRSSGALGATSPSLRAPQRCSMPGTGSSAQVAPHSAGRGRVVARSSSGCGPLRSRDRRRRPPLPGAPRADPTSLSIEGADRPPPGVGPFTDVDLAECDGGPPGVRWHGQRRRARRDGWWVPAACCSSTVTTRTAQYLRSLVPVSSRGMTTAGACPDNRLSALIYELPVRVTDPLERLEVGSTGELAALKAAEHLTDAGEVVTGGRQLRPPVLLGALTRCVVRSMHRFGQQSLNTVTTNVPGPGLPLYCLGREMLACLPIRTDRHGFRVGRLPSPTTANCSRRRRGGRVRPGRRRGGHRGGHRDRGLPRPRRGQVRRSPDPPDLPRTGAEKRSVSGLSRLGKRPGCWTRPILVDHREEAHRGRETSHERDLIRYRRPGRDDRHRRRPDREPARFRRHAHHRPRGSGATRPTAKRPRRYCGGRSSSGSTSSTRPTLTAPR